MKSLLIVLVGLLLSTSLKVANAADAFHEQNLVVLQIGDGKEFEKINTMPVVLKEFTTDGKIVQEIPLPTAASGSNFAFTHKRNRVGGALTRSLDGTCLVCGGVDLPPRSSKPGDPSPARTIARVDAAGNVDTSTRFKDAYLSLGEIGIRSVASVDGSSYWISGKGNENQGVRYIKHGGAETKAITDPAEETRHLAIVNTQLYVTPVAGVAKVGNGLPTPISPQTTTIQLSGIPLSGWNSPVLLDLDPTVPGVDTLYVVEDRKPNFAKFNFDGKTWKRNLSFVIKDVPAMLYITAKVEKGNVTLYGTTDSGSSGSFENELVEVRDIETGPKLRVLANAKPHMSFRGVSFAPMKKP